MFNFTTNTYEMKRDILNFIEKMSNGFDKPSSKFILDMIYGIEKIKVFYLVKLQEVYLKKLN